MTSGVSIVSDFVANGHQIMPNDSCSPSKIPYGGFSPVRLQTGCQPQPSPLRTYMRPSAHVPATWVSPLSVGARGNCLSTPVQRPLARQRVIVSRRVIAYYGLIRASRSLRPIWASGLFGRSLPCG